MSIGLSAGMWKSGARACGMGAVCGRWGVGRGGCWTGGGASSELLLPAAGGGGKASVEASADAGPSTRVGWTIVLS